MNNHRNGKFPVFTYCKRSLFSLFVVMFLATFSSSGSAASLTMQNGVPLTNLSGSAGATLSASLYIPSNTRSFMLTPSVNSTADVRVLDQYGNQFAECNWSNTCFVSMPIPGHYFVNIQFTQDTTDFSLVAAWGGADYSSLQNSVPMSGLPGKQGSFGLQTLYIPSKTSSLMVLPATRYNVEVHVLDQDGREIESCWSGNACLVNIPTPGLYFVKTLYLEENTDLNLVAAWGGSNNSSLQNTVPKTGLSGKQNAYGLETLYVPSKTNGLMVIPAESYDVDVQILNQEGIQIESCSNGDACRVDMPAPGLYYVRSFYFEDITDFSLVAAWGGPDNSSLQNGVPKLVPSGKQFTYDLQTLYIPRKTQRLSVSSAANYEAQIQIFDQYGAQIDECWSGSVCEVASPRSGLYYVRTYFYQDAPEFSLLAAWGAVTHAIH